MNSDRPIGVFDSGIGGLSVLKQLIRFLPSEEFIYLGDTGRVPYGNKSPEIVKLYSKQCTEFLLSKGVKLIVVACNTASSVAMDAVRLAAGEIPVIDMIKPAARAALQSTNNGNIGVIGTRATIGSRAYEHGIKVLPDGDSKKVFAKSCPLFVPLVEEGWTEHPVARSIAEEYLQNLTAMNIDTLVLGCTHYPLLSRLLNELLPGVQLIDSGEHASVNTLRLLADNSLLAPEKENPGLKPPIKFYVTDLPEMFGDIARRFLGFEAGKPDLVSLG